jgi:hypothetical protein
VGMAILPLPAVGDLTGPTRLSPRRTLPGPSRWLPRPATLRRRPQGMWGRGKPEKVNRRAPDRLDGNQVGRGVIWTGCRLGPSTDAAPDRAAEATSRKAGDGRHCSWLSDSRRRLHENGRAYGVYSYNCEAGAMSASAHFANSSRTSDEVLKVPRAIVGDHYTD